MSQYNDAYNDYDIINIIDTGKDDEKKEYDSQISGINSLINALRAEIESLKSQLAEERNRLNTFTKDRNFYGYGRKQIIEREPVYTGRTRRIRRIIRPEPAYIRSYRLSNRAPLYYSGFVDYGYEPSGFSYDYF